MIKTCQKDSEASLKGLPLTKYGTILTLKQMELKINSLLGKFRSKNKTQVRTDMEKKWGEKILEYDSQG